MGWRFWGKGELELGDCGGRSMSDGGCWRASGVRCSLMLTIAAGVFWSIRFSARKCSLSQDNVGAS